MNRAGRQREPFFRFYRNVAPRVVSIPYETVTPPERQRGRTRSPTPQGPPHEQENAVSCTLQPTALHQPSRKRIALLHQLADSLSKRDRIFNGHALNQ